MKRRLSILLVVLLAFSLIGCGAKETTVPEVTEALTAETAPQTVEASSEADEETIEPTEVPEEAAEEIIEPTETPLEAAEEAPAAVEETEPTLSVGETLAAWENVASVWVNTCNYSDAPALIGVKQDGTVCSYGIPKEDEEALSNQENIAKIAFDYASYNKIWEYFVLHTDGTVSHIGEMTLDYCDYMTGEVLGGGDPADWKNIVDIAGCSAYCLGVDSSGRFYFPNDLEYSPIAWSEMYHDERLSNYALPECGFTNVKAVYDVGGCYFALRKDGKIVTFGLGGPMQLLYYRDNGEKLDGLMSYFSEGSKDITALSVSETVYAELYKNGTASVITFEEDDLSDIDNWTNITAIAAGNGHVVGLCADGTVVACGRNDNGQCDVFGWEGVTSIAAGNGFTVGVTESGAALYAGIGQ